MTRIENLKAAYRQKRIITKEEYLAAKQELSAEDFTRRYRYEPWSDGDRYYVLEDVNSDDIMLLLLDDIRNETEAAKRYTKNIWYFIVTCLVLTGSFFAILFMASLL